MYRKKYVEFLSGFVPLSDHRVEWKVKTNVVLRRHVCNFFHCGFKDRVKTSYFLTGQVSSNNTSHEISHLLSRPLITLTTGTYSGAFSVMRLHMSCMLISARVHRSP